MSAPFTDVDDPKKYQWESAQNARLRLGSEGEALYSLQGVGPLATNIPKQPAELFSSLKWGAAAETGMQFWFERDIKVELAQFFAGDWKGLYEYGVALDVAAKGTSAIARNVNSGRRDLDRAWGGSAADSAQRYFVGLADSIDAQREPLAELPHPYKLAPHLAFESATAIGALLDQLKWQLTIMAMLVPEIPKDLYSGAKGSGQVAVIGATMGLALVPMIMSYLVCRQQVKWLWQEIEGIKKALGIRLDELAGDLSRITGLGGAFDAHRAPEPGDSYDHPIA